MIKFLDEGNYGKVYLAQNCKNNMIFSIKSIYRNRIKDSFMNQLIRELKIHSFLNHPNIVKLYGYAFDRDAIHMILEPCLSKNLS
jgi:aurora kinase